MGVSTVGIPVVGDSLSFVGQGVAGDGVFGLGVASAVVWVESVV